MKVDLDGRRALVTGANRGIGCAIALAFAEAGADVGINHLDSPQGAEQVAGEVRARGRRAQVLRADVSDPQQVSRMFAQLDEELGGVDLLVNNAGMEGEPVKAWELDVAQWRKVLDVNLSGAFYCAREALRRMVPARKGVILNITSVHETIPRSGSSPYTTSKAGVAMMSRTLAQETAELGIRVLCLAPGAVATRMNREVRQDPEERRKLLGRIPSDAVGEPGQISSMAVVLASDAASYVTGTTVFVDGGMTLYPSFE